MSRPAFTPEQKNEVRRKIRDAALRLKSERKGEITVRAVATEAGISVGAFYKYYENITELSRSLWSEPIQALRVKMQNRVADIEEPLERICILLTTYAEFEQEESAAFRNAFFFFRPPSMKKPEQLSLETDMFFSLLQEAVIEGQHSGQFKAGNASEMVQILWSAVHGALMLPITIDAYDFLPSQKMASNTIKFLCESIVIKK